ncbi:hypothetical protein DCAR_0205682 [Daucus carota subsp. sativus]|uniref:Uncharacterized protein n=1 Tax=Daucus carota subsp. sativus TaxID=79200 RepID=A0A166CS57_DAUCS|nr:hypothetical protein DCAR_0205682 [Daucus carota subsp. sativus]
MLGLPTLAANIQNEMNKKSKQKEKAPEEGSEYNPGDEDDVVDDIAEIPKKRNKKPLKMKLPGGPTTRSRSTVVNDPQKDGTDKEASLPNLVKPAAPIQLPQNEAVGSMAAHLAMRARQKEEGAKKKVVHASGNGSGNGNEEADVANGDNEMPDNEDTVEEVPKRTRGKTTMDKVHTRPFEKRVEVKMNDRFQPISDNDKVISEFGYFLGTLKKSVPLTYKSWRDVPDSLKTTLLNYVKANESDVALFAKTRKRNNDRDYKTDGKVTTFVVDKIEKVLGKDLSGQAEGVDELLLDGKAHGPSWLLGRCPKSANSSSSGMKESQISELTAKIRQDVVAEMDEKLKKKVQDEVDAKVNKKVQENLSWVLKKLGEANPGINVNLAELCATMSTDNEGTPLNENDTPLTRGGSS